MPPHSHRDGGELFIWKEGIPEPRNAKSMAREEVERLHFASLGLPYKGEWDAQTQSYKMEQRYKGLTLGEVMVLKATERAANGDHKAYTDIMDRVLGKPKQAVESVSLSMKYSDYLKHQEELDKSDPPPWEEAVDVEVQEAYVEPDDDDVLEGL